MKTASWKTGTSARGSITAYDAAAGSAAPAVVAPLPVRPLAGATAAWANASGGDWGTASNWSPSGVPTASTAATIALAGTYTVTISTPDSAQSLTVTDSGATLSDTSTLSIGTTLALAAGVFQLGNGGEVSGGTIAVASGADFQGDGGTLSGVKYDGTVDMAFDNASLTLTNGVTFAGANGGGTGTINVGGSDDRAYQYLNVAGSMTLNNVTLNIGDTGNYYGQYDYLVNEDTTGTGAVLTLGPNTTINQNGIYAGISSSDDTGDAIVNQGVINAGYYAGIFQIDATRFTNSGTITVSNNDLLNLTGPVSVALLNSINNAGGGEIRINSTVNNAGNTLTVAAGGELGDNGTISGGTLVSAGGGAGVYSSYGGDSNRPGYYGGENGTLSDVAVQGTLTIGGVGDSLSLANGTSFSNVGGTGLATINFYSGNYLNSYLYINGTDTLSNVVINIGTGNGNNGYDYVYNNDTTGNGATLTLASNTTINQTGQAAAIVGTDNVTDAIINKGTINAGYYAGIFQIDATRFTNSGTITVSNNDLLNLTGPVSVALLNSINNAGGGEIRINSTVNNAGNTLTVAAGGELGDNGTISGGTLVSAGGGAGVYSSYGGDSNRPGYYGGENGTLSDVAVQGTLTIGGVGDSLSLANGTSFSNVGGTGLATINFYSGNYLNSYLYINGTDTLSNVVINIGTGNGNNGYDYVYNNDTTGNGATLTLASNTTINQTGQAAAIVGTDNVTDAIINKGTINAGYYAGIFQIDATRFTNSGTITVSNNDLLNLTGPVSVALLNSINNAGGGEIRINSTVNNAGNTLTVAAGGELGDNGTISGGTLVSAGGGAGVYSSYGGDSNRPGYYGGENGTLSDVAVQGTLTIGGVGDSLSLANGTSFSNVGGAGLATINFYSGNYLNSYLYINGTDTLSNVVINIGTGNGNNGYDYVYNNDTTGKGATLTLASNVTINQTGQAAALTSSSNLGDGVVNDGTINADYGGGLFYITSLSFTNNGTVTVTNGDNFSVQPTNFTNLKGTTLTNGTYIANTNSAIELSNNLTIATDQANITLNGAGSNIQSYNTTTNTQTTLDSTLSRINPGGTLSLLSGRVFNATANSGNFGVLGVLNLAAGTLTATVFGNAGSGDVVGYGTISGAIVNVGTIEASNGPLLLQGSVLSTGKLQIDTGASLEITGATQASETTVFNGPGATLKMDTPTKYASVLQNFAGGDTLDFGKTTLTSVSLSGTTLLAVSSTGTTTLTLAAPATGLNLSLSNDGAGGTDVTAYNEAAPAPHAPEPVVLANAHVGSSDSAFITLTNSAPANGYSEKLDASLGSATGAATASGTVTKLAAGASNSTSLSVGIGTTAAGTFSGTATLALASDGTGVDNFGTTTLASQTVNVSGAVYAYAAGTLANAGTLTLQNTHVGQAASGFATLTNTAATGGFSEALDAAFAGASTGLSTSGTLQGLAAGAQNTNALQLAFAPANTGAYTGTATLALTSDGAGIDGLGTTALAAQTLTVKGNAYGYAKGLLGNGGTVAMANTHVGKTVGAFIKLTNSAATGGFSEALDASIKGSGTGFSGNGTVSGLAAGATSSTGLAVFADQTTAGTYTGSATVSLVSDGTNIDGLGTTALASQTVTITGNAYAYAAAQISSQNINLGMVHVGDAASAALTLTNTAAANVYSEALDAAWGTPSSGVSVAGSVSQLAAGASAQTLSIGLATSSSGSFSGTDTLSLLSDGTGIDGLGTTSLTGQTISVTGIVDAYALAAFQDGSGPAITGSGTNFSINLGSVLQGSAAPTLSLGALNAATGLSDLLQGTLSATGTTGFANSGFGTFANLAAGQGELSQGVTLTTGTAGLFTETVLLSSAGTNASGYDGALATETLTITGTVVTGSATNTYTLANGPNTIVGAAGGDFFIASAGSINTHDRLTGGSGSNTLFLAGGGTFDLDAPKTFANIQTVTASEGQAPLSGAADTRQTVFLPDGINETLNVRTEAQAQGNTNPETSTIYDGADNDTINLGSNADTLYLGSGSDTVTLGGKSNYVLAGGGTALVNATNVTGGAAVIGSTTGTTVVNVTTGGTVVLNAADTNITVKLNAATHLTLGALGAITADGSNGGDTVTAGGANQTLIGGAADVLNGSTTGTDTFAGTSAGLNGNTLGNWTTGDVIDLTDMNFSTLQALGFVAGTNKGTLTVTDGTHSSTFTVTATGLAAHNFTVLGADNSGGTLIGWHS